MLFPARTQSDPGPMRAKLALQRDRRALRAKLRAHAIRFHLSKWDNTFGQIQFSNRDGKQPLRWLF